MFQIMTEAQIREADEITLRQRARELQSATALFRQMKESQERYQERSLNILNFISELLRRQEERALRKPRRKPKRKPRHRR